MGKRISPFRVDPGRVAGTMNDNCEGGDRVLPSFAPMLSKKVGRHLGKLGVNVLLGAKVDRVDAEGVPISWEVFWDPMPCAMMGGIIIGTVLTLHFLPSLYVTWFRIRPVVAEEQ